MITAIEEQPCKDSIVLLEKLAMWANFGTSEPHEQSYFCKNVKPLLCDILQRLQTQRDMIEKLTRDLAAREAETAEYKTRVESLQKTNRSLEEINRTLSAEAQYLRQVMAQLGNRLAEESRPRGP